LGTLGTGTVSVASGLSSNGDIAVGQSTTSGAVGTRAFIWRNGVMTQLIGLDSTAVSAANSISADGTIVVGATVVSGIFRAWRLQNGLYTSLGNLGHATQYSRAFDVSADGNTVIGESRRADAAFRGFYWNNGTMTDIGTLASPYTSSFANGIDSTGTYIVGYAYGGLQPTQGFIWSYFGGMVGIGFPYPSFSLSRANAVSSNRIVVGIAAFSASELGSAFAYQNGVFTNLGKFAGYDFSTATDISADGSVIVGYCYTTSNGQPLGSVVTATAFRYTNGVMTNLGDLGTYSTPSDLEQAQLVGRDVSDDPTLASQGLCVSSDGLNVGGTSQVRMPSGAIDQHAFLYRILRIRNTYYDDNQKFVAQAKDDQKKFSDASSYTQFLKARASGSMVRYRG
jgi:probable HAF family extracellular repeat protein